YPSVARALFSKIGLCLAQTDRDAAHYRALGVPDVRVIGNLKFDTPPPVVHEVGLARLRAELGGRPAWIAASPHAGAEDAVASAHRLVAGAHPGALLVVAPRHPERGEAIAGLLAAGGFRVARRGLGEAVAPDTAVYVADTLGELGMFYSAIPVAFMGGSLVPHG